MNTALIVFMSMSLLGSVITMLATAGNRDYSHGQKVLIVFCKMLWMAFTIVLLVHLCSK